MGFRITGCGWWEYERGVEEGLFDCPRENNQRRYRIRRSSRWITLLWIPVIPLGTIGMYAECRSCKGVFRLEALASSGSGGHAGTSK